MSNGFPLPDPYEDHYARNIEWGLDLVQNRKGSFANEFSDVQFIYKICDLRQFKCEYTYSSPENTVEKGLVFYSVIATLRVRKTDNRVYLAMTGKWWCTHRTQRHFPGFQFDMTDINGTPLTYVSVPSSRTFVIDCQAVKEPGDDWSMDPIDIGKVEQSYFNFVKFGEITNLPPNLPGDHGSYCH